MKSLSLQAELLDHGRRSDDNCRSIGIDHNDWHASDRNSDIHVSGMRTNESWIAMHRYNQPTAPVGKGTRTKNHRTDQPPDEQRVVHQIPTPPRPRSPQKSFEAKGNKPRWRRHRKTTPQNSHPPPITEKKPRNISSMNGAPPPNTQWPPLNHPTPNDTRRT